MHPVMLEWRGHRFHSYPAMQSMGIMLGVLAGNIAARSAGLDHFKVWLATIVLLLPALAGGRLLHVVTRWNYYRARRSLIWDTRTGGGAQYGGIVVAVPLSLPLLWYMELPFGAFWDIASITLMVGVVITRIGCFLNGCCAGRETQSWLAVYLPNVRGEWKRRYPTQLFEAASAATLLAAGLVLWTSLSFDGALFIFVSCGYALGRLVLQSIREDAARRFTIQHGISLVIIGAGLTALFLRG